MRSPAALPMPSLPVTALAVTLIVVGYALMPKGRIRNVWFTASALAIALLAISRLYLGYEHPTDIAVAVVLGVGMGILAFRVFAPSRVFPISY